MRVKNTEAAALDGDELGALDQPTDETRTTDLGLARRFVDQFGDHVRYTKAAGFFTYEKTHWQLDETGAVYRMIAKTADAIWRDFTKVPSDARARWMRFCERAESAVGQTAALKLAGTRRPIAVRLSDFDTDTMILNTPSGVVDLATGKLRPHRSADLLSKITSAPYDPTAACPRWLDFLAVAFRNNADLIDYVQRALGYSITGDVSEHKVFLAYGSGRNGKSTLLNTVQTVLGTYARTGDPELLLAHRSQVHPTRLADLHGARFVTSIETDEGRHLAEALTKWLTGGDPITARRCHKDSFEFLPTHHLWLAANHRPGVHGTDEGIWSRIHLIPFEVYLPDALGEKYAPHFITKLKAEHAGILRWLVEGCLAWLRHGLKPPDEVLSATAEYRKAMDSMGRFIADRCVTTPTATAPAAALYNAYKAWADATGEHRQPQTKFNEYLEIKRGFKWNKSNMGKYWIGIEIRCASDGSEESV